MTEAGWYPDPADPKLLRWWDGSAWTDHLHRPETPPAPGRPTPPVGGPTDAEAPAATQPVAGTAPPVVPSVSVPVHVAIYLAFGIFLGLMNGMVSFNAVSAYGPSTTESATITGLDVDFDTTGNMPDNTLWVEGTTESGKDWRFASDEIYEIADREGYPLAVTVTFSDWADTIVAIEGPGFDEDRRDLVNRTVWPAATLLITIASLIGTRYIARSQGGLIVGMAFLVGFLLIGTYLGFIAIRWYRMP